MSQKFRHSELDSESKKQTLKQRISVRHLCRLARKLSENNGVVIAKLSERERNPRQVQGDKTTFHLPLSTFNSYKKVAFILAEVLITLGIIGVVAAMTIPTLVAKYREKAVITALKRTYSMLSQAFTNIITNDVTPDVWDLNNADEFRDLFAKYLKNVKKCDRMTVGITLPTKY